MAGGEISQTGSSTWGDPELFPLSCWKTWQDSQVWQKEKTNASVVLSLCVTRQTWSLEPRTVGNCRHLWSASFGPGLASRGQNKEEKEIDHYLDDCLPGETDTAVEVLERYKDNLIFKIVYFPGQPPLNLACLASLEEVLLAFFPAAVQSGFLGSRCLALVPQRKTWT